MEYIIQIFTGGWRNRLYQTAQIMERLITVTSLVKVKKVIIGWNIETEQYRTICTWLHQKGIEVYLWLPVFSEIGELTQVDRAVDIWQRELRSYMLQEGENFDFYCPSSAANQESAVRVYQDYFGDCGFDGVFLDKIRSQSFIGGYEGIVSCGCPRCQKHFEAAGVSIEALREKLDQGLTEELFSAESFSQRDGFRLRSEEMAAFLKAKQGIFTRSVVKIAGRLRDHGLKIGLDVFYPALAPFVGQDIEALSAAADFIKPMMYRRTNAPAGIGFEYRMLKSSLGGNSSYDQALGGAQLEQMSDEFFIGQLEAAVSRAEAPIYAGIEVNYQPAIAVTDQQYTEQSIRAVQRAGCPGAVLSWDIMQAPLEHIKVLSDKSERVRL